MKLLLDTHTFVWWDSDLSQLSASALNALKDPANSLVLSVVSIWEIVMKQQLNKLTLHLPLISILSQQENNGLEILGVQLDHVLAVEKLPAAHKDPFDRLLIAQANVEGLTLVSADALFTQYPVTVLW
jgi:PIN domain nuclease of toxin-antitoxin system